MRAPAADAHRRFGIDVHDGIFHFAGNLGKGVGKVNGRGHREDLGIRGPGKTFGRPNPVGNHRANQDSDSQGLRQ